MRNLFRGYYKPTSEELADIWKNCIFSFDANVLLHIYCYTPETRDRFFEVLYCLKERIWISHQAAYEYQKNRIHAIARYVKAYGEIESILNKKFQELKMEIIPEYELHPLINTQHMLNHIEEVIEKVKYQIRIAQKQHPNYLEHDELREALTNLLDGKVGKPYSEEELEIIYQKAEKRFSYKKPPGYKDAGKPVPRGYGDVIIWFQLMDYARIQQKPLIFVTDDNKEDWWLKYDGESIEPRPDLIQEILSEVGGEKFQFYMYHSDQFLDYAEKFLGLPVQPEVVKEAREIIMLENSVDKEKKVETDSQDNEDFGSSTYT
jgi:DNA-directed RNA polymerase subunit F